jgi:uncharacterized protein with HEPN domain
MIKRSVTIRLRDMLGAVDEGLEIVSGMTFEDYQRTVVVRRAIERCVEIVSEASRHVPDTKKDRYPGAHWQEIKAIGNLLRHEYQRVDDLVMWRIAKNYFPELRRVIADMLNESDEA